MIVSALSAALACLAMLAPGQVDPAAFEGAPAAALELLPAEARRQVTAQEIETTRLLADAVDQRALAESLGELGKLYYVYGLSGLAGEVWAMATEVVPGDSRWHYYGGVLDRIEGRLERALEHFERVLELRPEDLPTRIRVGRIELERGRFEAAGAAFEAVLERAPENGAALAGLGRVALAEHRYEAAIALLERALTSQGEGSVLHHQLGLAYRALGDLDQARSHLARNQGVVISMSDPLMEQLALRVKGAHFHARLGIQALKAGKSRAAIEFLERAVALDSASAWIRYNLAVAYRDSGLSEKSRAAFLATLDLDPEYRNAHFNLGALLAVEEDFAGAAQHFARAREIDPMDYSAALELAVALSRLGDHERALAELRNLIAAAPQFHEARMALVTLLAQMGRPAEALAVAEALLALDATDSERARAHGLAGRLLESRSPAAAEAHYRAALELSEDAEEERYRLALILGRMRRFADSAAQFEVLVLASPANVDYRQGQSLALLLGEHYGRATEALEAALEQLPADLSIAHSLSRLLAACPDGGIRDGARALELARRVFEQQQSIDHAETIAMALAEVGNFAEAVEWQQQVVEQRRRQGAGARLEVSRGYLELFRQGEGVRAPWMEGG
jgi:tetratricopeptide (TPR) repeat protein